MRFDVLTLFPDVLKSYTNSSILLRAQKSELLSVFYHDIRAVAKDKHKSVDDTPYGGGAGMVLKVDIIDQVLQEVLTQPEIQAVSPEKRRIILLTPQGRRLRQNVSQELADNYEQITLICGHYEGFDERIRYLVDEELSIGDFVLTGGELAALVTIDSVARLQKGVLSDGSPEEESFCLFDETGKALLEYPHYTRPLEYKGQSVPEVLLSGNHAEIAKWRLQKAKEKTLKRESEGI